MEQLCPSAAMCSPAAVQVLWAVSPWSGRTWWTSHVIKIFTLNMDLNQPHLKNTQTFFHIKRYLISYIFYPPDSKDDTALTGVCHNNSKNELNHPKGPQNSFNSSLMTPFNFLLREWKTEFFCWWDELVSDILALFFYFPWTMSCNKFPFLKCMIEKQKIGKVLYQSVPSVVWNWDRHWAPASAYISLAYGDILLYM